MFLLKLRKMEFDLRKVEPVKSNLIGFSGKVKVLEGRITLPITMGIEANHITIMDEFHVVDAPSPYNITIGRSWLYDLGIIPSLYHQFMKLIIREEVVMVKGDQKEGSQ